ncbi:uncharacterized protein LOC144030764 isoform X2 [Festucalex cinctus]
MATEDTGNKTFLNRPTKAEIQPPGHSISSKHLPVNSPLCVRQVSSKGISKFQTTNSCDVNPKIWLRCVHSIGGTSGKHSRGRISHVPNDASWWL